MKSFVLTRCLLSLLVVFAACQKINTTWADSPSTNNRGKTISVDECEKCLVVSEQYKDRVAVLDVNSQKFIWEWTPQTSNIPSSHWSWFRLIDEAKPIYNNKYILLTATSGGVALVRIADKKTVWYSYSDGKPHSAEILPDGNVVVANATGLTLTFFAVDTLVSGTTAKKKYFYLGEGHNAVWDKNRNVLWTTSHDALKAFRYNNNCGDPYLVEQEVERINLPGSLPHDLFPVHGEDALWLSTTDKVHKFDMATKRFTTVLSQNKVKSISSGPVGFPTVIIHGKEDYWTDEIKDVNGVRIYQENKLKIYKARWLLNNEFSYLANDKIKQCN